MIPWTGTCSFYVKNLEKEVISEYRLCLLYIKQNTLILQKGDNALENKISYINPL